MKPFQTFQGIFLREKNLRILTHTEKRAEGHQRGIKTRKHH